MKVVSGSFGAYPGNGRSARCVRTDLVWIRGRRDVGSIRIECVIEKIKRKLQILDSFDHDLGRASR